MKKNIEEHYAIMPNTDFITNNTFWFGVFPTLSKKELDKTASFVHKFIKENCK